MNTASDRRIVVGRVTGLYGVRGWIRIHSYTQPLENILSYGPWLVEGSEGWTAMDVEEGRRHGKGLVVRLRGCEGRDEARRLIGADIAVARRCLPDPDPGEYYWCDLMGARVLTRTGDELGRVEKLLATGANDVLVVRGAGEHLIPFIEHEVVLDVDPLEGLIRVDWE